MTGSLSFDAAAEVYDRTRLTDATSLASAIDLLDDALAPGRVLEIGVGTGALAVPMASRGRALVGIDLSMPMLEKLRAKDMERGIAIAIADATRLPFADDVFTGAYCRWVLHLIPGWREAVRHLCRVVRPGGVVIVAPGGYTGSWREVWLRFVEEIGSTAEPVGLDVRRGYAELDAAFAEGDGVLRAVQDQPAILDVSLNAFFQEVAARSYSWTWGASDADLARAVDVVRAWALERYGADLDAPFDPDAPHGWRIYDIGD